MGLLTTRCRRWCFAAMLALGGGSTMADEHDGMELVRILAGAVLDWCDTQDGDFRLPHISTPVCGTGGVAYLGTLRGAFGAVLAPDAAWWWDLRTDLPDDFMVGVLWYVGPNDNPKALCAASRGEAVSVRRGARGAQQPGPRAGGTDWSRGRASVQRHEHPNMRLPHRGAS